MPSAVHLQLSDFANFPVLLPFESLANDTAEQFDPAVPGYMYNVTLRVEAIDKNKHEVSWSIQDIRRKEAKSTAWLQLQRRSNKKTVSVKLSSIADGVIKGELVNFQHLNATV